MISNPLHNSLSQVDSIVQKVYQEVNHDYNRLGTIFSEIFKEPRNPNLKCILNTLSAQVLEEAESLHVFFNQPISQGAFNLDNPREKKDIQSSLRERYLQRIHELMQKPIASLPKASNPVSAPVVSGPKPARPSQGRTQPDYPGQKINYIPMAIMGYSVKLDPNSKHVFGEGSKKNTFLLVENSVLVLDAESTDNTVTLSHPTSKVVLEDGCSNITIEGTGIITIGKNCKNIRSNGLLVT